MLLAGILLLDKEPKDILVSLCLLYSLISEPICSTLEFETTFAF